MATNHIFYFKSLKCSTLSLLFRVFLPFFKPGYFTKWAFNSALFRLLIIMAVFSVHLFLRGQLYSKQSTFRYNPSIKTSSKWEYSDRNSRYGCQYVYRRYSECAPIKVLPLLDRMGRWVTIITTREWPICRVIRHNSMDTNAKHQLHRTEYIVSRQEDT